MVPYPPLIAIAYKLTRHSTGIQGMPRRMSAHSHVCHVFFPPRQVSQTTQLYYLLDLRKVSLIVGTSGAAKAKIKSDEYQLAAVDIRVCITLRGAYAFLVVYL